MALASRRRACACLRIHTPGPPTRRQFSDDALIKAETTIPVNYGVGRQSISGITATCFGATGFVGPYIVQKLARCGSDVVVPFRGDGLETRPLKGMGDLGKITPLPVDYTDEATIRRLVPRSNVIINLLGGEVETKNYNYHDANVKLVHRICKIAAESGSVKRFIHFSALGADLKSPSAFLRAKAEGELVVRDFFPHATILRPAPIFGEEDKYLNYLCHLVNFSHIVPMLGNGETKVQPVHVVDVAMAVLAACVDSEAPGRTYELGGPEVLSRKEVLEWVARNLEMPPNETVFVPLPKRVIKLASQLLSWYPVREMRMLLPDQVAQAEIDLVVSKGAHTIEDLGITPYSLDQAGTTVTTHQSANRDQKKWGLTKGDPRESRLRLQ